MLQSEDFWLLLPAHKRPVSGSLRLSTEDHPAFSELDRQLDVFYKLQRRRIHAVA